MTTGDIVKSLKEEFDNVEEYREELREKERLKEAQLQKCNGLIERLEDLKETALDG